MAQNRTLAKLANWFFQNGTEKSVRDNYTRFLEDHDPSENTHRSLLENSVAMFAEEDSRAMKTTGGGINVEAGLVTVASDAQAKAGTAQLNDRTIVTEPSQLPTVDAGAAQAISGTTVPFVTAELIDVADDGTLTKNNFLVKLSETFRTWLSSLSGQVDIMVAEDLAIRGAQGTNTGDTDLGVVGDYGAILGSVTTPITTIGALQELENAIAGITPGTGTITDANDFKLAGGSVSLIAIPSITGTEINLKGFVGGNAIDITTTNNDMTIAVNDSDLLAGVLTPFLLTADKTTLSSTATGVPIRGGLSINDYHIKGILSGPGVTATNGTTDVVLSHNFVAGTGVTFSTIADVVTVGVDETWLSAQIAAGAGPVDGHIFNTSYNNINFPNDNIISLTTPIISLEDDETGIGSDIGDSWSTNSWVANSHALLITGSIDFNFTGDATILGNDGGSGTAFTIGIIHTDIKGNTYTLASQNQSFAGDTIGTTKSYSMTGNLPNDANFSVGSRVTVEVIANNVSVTMKIELGANLFNGDTL